MAQSVEELVSKARSRTLAANDPDYQDIVRRARQGVQADKNALERIDDAGGASSSVSVNRII